MNKYWNNMIVKALIVTDEQEIVSGYQEMLINVPNTIALIVNIIKLILKLKIYKFINQKIDT